MNLSVTLNFASLSEARRVLAQIPDDVIAPEDRPDAGADQLPLAFAELPPAGPSAAQVFGGAAAPSGPPLAAPSTAGAAALPTAPAAPTPGLPLPPNASSLPAAPIAPAAPAPTAGVAPANPAGVEVDASGLPWDERIHAGGRAKNKDGTWRSRRGVNDEAKVRAIEAELRQAMAAPQAAAVPQAPVPQAAPVPTFASLMVKTQRLRASAALDDARLASMLGDLQLSGLGQLAARPDLVPALDAMLDAVLPQ